MMKRIRQATRSLGDSVDRPWFLPLLFFLGVIDNFMMILPTDVLVTSGAVIRPKRWARLSLVTATGSALGALVLAVLARSLGEATIQNWFGNAFGPEAWLKTKDWIHHYGAFAVAFICGAPVPYQPAVIISSLAQMPLGILFVAIWVGRCIKFGVLAWTGAQTSRWISRKKTESVPAWPGPG